MPANRQKVRNGAQYYAALGQRATVFFGKKQIFGFVIPYGLGQAVAHCIDGVEEMWEELPITSSAKIQKLD